MHAIFSFFFIRQIDKLILIFFFFFFLISGLLFSSSRFDLKQWDNSEDRPALVALGFAAVVGLWTSTNLITVIFLSLCSFQFLKGMKSVVAIVDTSLYVLIPTINIWYFLWHSYVGTKLHCQSLKLLKFFYFQSRK